VAAAATLAALAQCARLVAATRSAAATLRALALRARRIAFSRVASRAAPHLSAHAIRGKHARRGGGGGIRRRVASSALCAQQLNCDALMTLRAPAARALWRHSSSRRATLPLKITLRAPS
jgi:hypothetical protein